MSLDDLIALLEKAEGGSRELDLKIAEVCGIVLEKPKYKRGHYIGNKPVQTGVKREAKHPYSSSIDAALTLVPEGVNDWDFRCRNSVAFKVTLYRPSREYEGRSPVLAIALCIAALKARKEQP